MIATLSLLIVAACSGGGRGGAFTLHGRLTLGGGRITFATATTGAFYAKNGKCFGANGYTDVGPGAQVTVKDETGTTVGLGRLGMGAVRGGACVLPFAVPGVPSGHRFYSVSVSRRGAAQFTAGQATGGRVDLTLG